MSSTATQSQAPASAGAPAEATTQRQQWSGQFGFILSAIGSAVGLGNIWRFPGVAYENGGGAFMIPYLVAILTAGIPILFLDYSLGHRFHGSPPLVFRRIKKWMESAGWFQFMLCIFIMLYYAAILAWAGSYFVFSFNLKWGDDPVSFFNNDFLHLSDPSQGLQLTPSTSVLIPLIIVWVGVIAVMAFNLSKGLEKVNIIGIPLLVVAFTVLVVRSVFLPGATDGLNQLFTPDFGALADPSVWIAAYSQVFYSLSIAFGIMMTYSSYRKRRSNLTSPGLVVAFANSSFELLAGIGVFSVLGFMAYEQGTTIDQLGSLSGVGLSFVTFPKAISQMPGGQLLGALFFFSLFMAGFTSMISIFEVISATCTDKFGWGRKKAALVIGIPAAVVSIVLFGAISGLNTLDIVDKFTNEVGIVTSAIVMIVLVMWVARKGNELSYHLSALSTFKVGRTWRFLVSVLCPVVLSVILVTTVVDLIQNPYGGYPRWYSNLAGWGVVAVMVVGSLVLAATKWRRNTDDLLLYPPYPAAQATQKGVQA